MGIYKIGKKAYQKEYSEKCKQKLKHNCPNCGKITYYGTKCQRCSIKKGEKSHQWEGGRHINTQGYVLIWKPNHPRADCNGYVREHLLVMEEKWGRSILSREKVHHLDYDKTNNSPDNLQLFPNERTHQKYHFFLRKCVRDMLAFQT